MDLTNLKQVIQPLYRTLDSAHRHDATERLERRAREIALAEQAAGHDVQPDTVAVLATLLHVRAAIFRELTVRSSVEACLVELGWTSLRIRELLRSLENLPDKPQKTEERVVADADLLETLGVRGLAREAMSIGQRGEDVATLLDRLHKTLGRRVYTGAAQPQALRLKEETRAFWKTLKEG